MRRIDHGTAGRAARAARAAPKRRTHPSPSHDDRLATEAMAPRSVFVPRAVIKKPGPQYEAPPKPPGRRGWGTQAVGPTTPARRPYTPYQRALGRPLGVDIRHQTPTQIAGVTEHLTPRQQREQAQKRRATAYRAAAARGHAGAAPILDGRHRVAE